MYTDGSKPKDKALENLRKKSSIMTTEQTAEPGQYDTS